MHKLTWFALAILLCVLLVCLFSLFLLLLLLLFLFLFSVLRSTIVCLLKWRTLSWWPNRSIIVDLVVFLDESETCVLCLLLRALFLFKRRTSAPQSPANRIHASQCDTTGMTIFWSTIVCLLKWRTLFGDKICPSL